VLLGTDSIIGRDAELELLKAVLGGPAAPSLVLIEGEPGMGKTATLEAAAAAVDRRVLWARPSQAEAQSSYAALDDLVRPVRELLPRLPEPQRRALAAALGLEVADAPVEPRLTGLAFLTLLSELRDPVLLAIDDWHWLDAASAAVVSFALRRIRPEEVKVVGAVRTGAADHAVAALVRALPEEGVVELPLGPLAPADLKQLVHARTGAWLPAPALDRLHARCAGNPLLALELVRDGAESAATDIRRLLARRVGGLSRDARAALRFAAALPVPSSEAVEEALGDTERARRGLDEALAAGIVVRDGVRLRFGHPLFAEAVEEVTPASEWRAIHLRLAALTDGPEDRARHLADAASGPDAEVAAVLDGAAQEARGRGALGAAARFAERAAELTPAPDGDARARRRLDAADAHTDSGDGPRARGLLEALLEEVPHGPPRAEALHRLAFLVGDASGPRLTEDALAEAGDDDRLLAAIHITRSGLVACAGGLPTALRHAEAAVAHGERAGEPMLLADALSSLAFCRWVGGGGLQRELLERADALEREGSGRGGDDTAAMLLAMQLRVSGALAEARRILVAEIERSVERGRVDHEAFALRELAALEVRAGRWRLADAHARRLHEVSTGMEFFNSEAEVHWVAALVDAHLGRVESAREHAEKGHAISVACGDRAWSTNCLHVLGFLELSLGQAEAAVARLAGLPAQERALGCREPALRCIAPDLAEALVLAGDLDGARAVAAELEALGRELNRTWAIASALRCRGLIAAAEGRVPDALADLASALAAHAGLPQPFDRARTLLALGATQRRAKQRAEARGSLEAALAVFGELGATLWTARARSEIGRLGGRRSRDPDELTETERQIAELAGNGRSNREIAAELFVSERTVEANLTRSYRKLGVRSRTELARRLPAP
jgi:DNA-binding CsgD family transcriptional regulator